MNKDQIQAKYGIKGNSRVLEWCCRYGPVVPEVTPEITPLSKVERLSIFKNDLLEAKAPTNPKDALSLINKTLDNVKSKYATSKDRMYGILDDKYVTYHDDGSVTAKTTGQIIQIQQNGDFSIINKKDGSTFLDKIKEAKNQ